MIKAIIVALLLTLNPTVVLASQKEKVMVVATAYCLKGKTTSGPKTSQIKGGCIALSRNLAQDLGLKKGKGEFNYAFGVTIELIGVGKYIFSDLMPKQWKHYRVDVWHPTLKQCHVFGVKKCQLRIVK